MVAARGYLEPGVAARYFTAGLWEAGYFPVVFHFENRGMGTFEVERTRITIRRERGGAVDAPKAAEPLAPRPVAEILERCRRSSSPAYLLAPLFIFPAVWARGEIERYNFELVKDLEGKALPGYYRLEPESPPLRGAVFFSRPEGEPLVELLKGAELRLDVMIEGSRMPASEKSDTPGAEPDETRVGETLTFILPLTSVGE